MSITFRPLSYALGAEVSGLDISSEISVKDWDALHDGFLRYGVLLIRGQRIDRNQHLAFSRRFGKLDRHESLPLDRLPEIPELLMVTNDAKPDGSASNSKYTGQLWHSDMSFTLIPALGSMLRAVAVPPVGGDTLFSNMVQAYETLSPVMRDLIEPLYGIHHSERKNSGLSQEWEAENSRLNPSVAQPVVRVHPETKKKALYIGEKVKCFEGMTPAESQPIIDFLIRHATRPQLVYRHQWQVDDILIWDNRSTSHLALGDYEPSHRRHLERTTIIGTPSGHIASNKELA